MRIFCRTRKQVLVLSVINGNPFPLSKAHIDRVSMPPQTLDQARPSSVESRAAIQLVLHIHTTWVEKLVLAQIISKQ